MQKCPRSGYRASNETDPFVALDARPRVIYWIPTLARADAARVCITCITNTKKKVQIRKKVSRKKVIPIILPKASVKKVVKKVAQAESKDFGSRLTRNFLRPGLGKAIGDTLLPGVGGALGHAAESIFRTIFGQGAYLYSDSIGGSDMPLNNTLVGMQTETVKASVDQMHWDGLATRIAHREYMGEITTSTTFTANLLAIYPTNVGMFPWLSDIAHKFQKWKLLGMVFEYVPTSSPIATNSPALGSISLAIQYDTYLPAPTTLAAMLNWQGAVTGRPSDHLVCAVECDGSYTPMNPLYVRRAGSTPIENLTTFGNLIIGKSGSETEYIGGQLWVSYDIQLIAAYVELPAASLRYEEDTKAPVKKAPETHTHQNTDEAVLVSVIRL